MDCDEQCEVVSSLPATPRQPSQGTRPCPAGALWEWGCAAQCSGLGTSGSDGGASRCHTDTGDLLPPGELTEASWRESLRNQARHNLGHKEEKAELVQGVVGLMCLLEAVG